MAALSKARLDAQADFEDGPTAFSYYEIMNWARDPDGGALPPESAKAFSQWINNAWNDFQDEGVTNEDVLKGAVESWCGGRTF